MPNETETQPDEIKDENSEVLSPILSSSSSDSPKPKTTRKPKPLVEGINAPSLKSTPVADTKPELTEAEKKLMMDAPAQSSFTASPIKLNIKREDPKLMPKAAMDRASGKKSSFARNFVSLVILVLLGFGGWQFYNWYMDRPSGLETGGNTQITPTPTPSATVTLTPTPTNASSTPPLGGDLDVPPTPTGTAQLKLKINSTPTGYLNVRQQPTTSAEQVGRVNPGEIYIYTETKNGWYKIILDSGQSGWVTGQYITKQ